MKKFISIIVLSFVSFTTRAMPVDGMITIWDPKKVSTLTCEQRESISNFLLETLCVLAFLSVVTLFLSFFTKPKNV